MGWMQRGGYLVEHKSGYILKYKGKAGFGDGQVGMQNGIVPFVCLGTWTGVRARKRMDLPN
jgi:hypothetical protein